MPEPNPQHYDGFESDSVIDEEDENSDEESLYADSPADGFFEQNEIPRETFVENSSVQAEAEAKAREAAAQERSDGAASAPVNWSTNSLQHRALHAWVNESTPLLDAGPAPPDYAAATAGQPDRSHDQRRPLSSHEPVSEPHLDLPSNSNDRPWPFGQRGNPFGGAPEERQWPFGQRGSPFGQPAEDAQWPLGNRGNPFGNSVSATERPSRHSHHHGHHHSHHAEQDGALGNPALFIPGRQVQSMRDSSPARTSSRDHTYLVHEDSRSHHGSKRQTREKWKRRGCCSLRTSLNWLTVFGIILLIVFLSRVMSEEGNVSNDPVGRNRPSQIPNVPIDGGDDGDRTSSTLPSRTQTSTVHIPTATGPIPPPLTHSSRCAFTTFNEPKSFDFTSLRSFYFMEMMEPSRYVPGGISGRIRIYPAPSDQDVDIRAWVSVASTKGFALTDLEYTHLDDSLEIQLPEVQGSSRTSWWQKPCLDVDVHLQIKSDITLDEYAINTANFDVLATNNTAVKEDSRYAKSFGKTNGEGRGSGKGRGSSNREHAQAPAREELLSDLPAERRANREEQRANREDQRADREEKRAKARRGVGVRGASDGKSSLRPLRSEQDDIDRYLDDRKVWLDFADMTKIHATRGEVKLDNWSSRETYIDTSSGSISGTYELYDILEVSSQSGSVKINVEPKEVDAEHVAPAKFTVTTASGSIAARLPLTGRIPDRDYQTRVESRSGTVKGDYIHGSTSSFSTNSGSFHLNLLPYSTEQSHSSLRTQTSSGSTKISVWSPYKKGSGSADDQYNPRKGIIDSMRSVHKTSSASVDLTYPQEWEGLIVGKSNSGSIKIEGKDVKRLADTPYLKQVMARKGAGSSKLDVETASGSIKVQFND